MPREGNLKTPRRLAGESVVSIAYFHLMSPRRHGVTRRRVSNQASIAVQAPAAPSTKIHGVDTRPHAALKDPSDSQLRIGSDRIGEQTEALLVTKVLFRVSHLTRGGAADSEGGRCSHAGKSLIECQRLLRANVTPSADLSRSTRESVQGTRLT